MRYSNILTSIIILAVFAQSASAAASKEENIGIGSGAVVGALAGGPVGFFVGAVIGAKLGEKAHLKSEQISTLEDSLQNSGQSVAKLQRGVDELTTKLEQVQNTSRPELIRLMQAGIDMDLLFRTDEFALTDTTGERLTQMAATLANMTDVRIQLDGFADERGASDYNLALSEKRVEFVRNLLIGSGIHPTRVSTSAHGEAVAQDQDVDSYALERRVSVRLFIDNTQPENPQSLASNPN